MELLSLLPLVSLVSARCNNIVSSCSGPNGNLITDNILNFANYGYRQPSYVTDFTGGRLRSDCLSTDVIPLSLREVFCKQPSYTRIVENSSVNRQRDSICTTFFPVPDNDKSYIAYVSTVTIYGSNEVVSFIFTEIAPGVFGVANADFTVTQRFYGSIGDSLLVSCARTEFGDSEYPESIVSSLSSYSPLELGCLQDIQQIMDCNGLTQSQGLYVLPYRLPPRCYTQQTCFSTNPFTTQTRNY